MSRLIRSHRVSAPLSLALLATILLVPLTNHPAQADESTTPRLLLHVRPAGAGLPCSPGISGCALATVTGALYVPGRNNSYYVYLLAAGFDTEAGAGEIRVGIDYDQTTISGVDIFSWNLCAHAQTPSPDWFQQGGENRITWTAPDCPHDSLAVAGYFYLTAYTPGRLALIHPAGAPASVTPCGGAAAAVDSTSLGFVGFGGEAGCNPCLGPCDYTPVAGTTWGAIKAHFRSR